jgi:cellobiose phosphorylase
MLYGFLGFRPTIEGCAIAPRLPGDWPSLTITRVHFRERVLDIAVEDKTIRLADRNPAGGPLRVDAPTGWTVLQPGGGSQ